MLTTSALNFDSRCCLTEDEMICPEATKMLWSNETVTQIIILPRTESRVSSSQSVSQSLFYFSFFQITEAFCKPYIYTNISQSFKHSGWVFFHEVVSCKKSTHLVVLMFYVFFASRLIWRFQPSLISQFLPQFLALQNGTPLLELVALSAVFDGFMSADTSWSFNMIQHTVLSSCHITFVDYGHHPAVWHCTGWKKAWQNPKVWNCNPQNVYKNAELQLLWLEVGMKSAKTLFRNGSGKQCRALCRFLLEKKEAMPF